MASINKVMLLGNVTREPELSYTTSGKSKLELGIAVNDRYKDSTGALREEATFVDLIFWGKQAESAAQYVRKGTSLFIEGKLKQEEWEDKTTGQKKRKTRVVVENWQFTGPKPADAAPRQERSESRPARAGSREEDPW